MSKTVVIQIREREVRRLGVDGPDPDSPVVAEARPAAGIGPG
jgi:hypothetical protein